MLITFDAVAKVKAQINKLNKRALKLGVDQIVATFSEKSIQKFDMVNGTSMALECVDVIVNAPKISLDGWRFKATIKHVENVVIVNGETESSYYHVDSHRCDHCNVKHARVKQVVVSNDTEEKVVGLSCMKDFLGHDSLSAANSAYAFIDALNDLLEGIMADTQDYAQGGGNLEHYNLNNIVDYASTAISIHGYVSTNTAGYLYDTSTKDRVLNYVSTKYTTPEGIELAKKTKEFFAGLEVDANDSFVMNMKNILTVGYVPKKLVGIAIYAPQHYLNHLAKIEKERLAKEVVDSKYIGSVGKREEFVISVDKIIKLQDNYSYYGCTKDMVIARDQSSNVIVWFASGCSGMDAGETYSVKATVKNHDEYNGVKQTIVNRVKII